MEQRRQILVVARNPRLADRLVAWLGDSGHAMTLVTAFSEAKARLKSLPDLIISELKLGEYNGLHLALRADAAGVPSIIIGPPDAVLERDAASITSAVYLQASVSRPELLEAVSRALSSAGSASHRRLFHTPVTTIAAEADLLWRAFSESSQPVTTFFGRTMLPN
jgi:DNA-binding response OmpR family regulator